MSARNEMHPGSGMALDKNNTKFDVTEWRKDITDKGVPLKDNEGNLITVQNPLPTNGDSVYAKDVSGDSTSDGFIGGTVDDLVSGGGMVLVNDSSTNPKEILIDLIRPIQTNIFGLSTDGGDFSNVVLSAGIGDPTNPGVETTIYDGSADSTKRTLLVPDVPPVTMSYLRIRFHTADTVSLSTVIISKALQRIARIQGSDPDGYVKDFQATRRGNFKVSIDEYGDTAAIDSFARLRISEPYTIFDSKQIHDKQPLFWDEELGGTATSAHVLADAAVKMQVMPNSSDYVMRQTKQRFNYQPGKSQLILMTFYAPSVTGVKSRIGSFQGYGPNYLVPNNGIFFENSSGALSWVIAKNGLETEVVPQSSWNVDPLDGTGDSGLTLSMSATQIIVIDFEWLGVGRVRVGFVIDGIIRYCHYFNHANNPTFTSVYMSTPNLPLRYSIEGNGSNGLGRLDHICSTVMSEGGIEQTGILRSIDTGTTHVDADTANSTYAVVGMRLKSSYLDVTVTPEFFSMINTVKDDFRWSLCLNPTIAGTFTYNDIADSAVQYARGATANTVSAEGLVIDSGYAVASTSGGASDRQFVTSLRMGSAIDGTRDEVVLCVTPLSAGADIHGSLTFRELL